jgi:MFS family permease
MPTGEIGTWLALIAGVGGGLGTFLGGYFADRLGERDQRWYVWLPGLATLISVPFAAFTYLWSDAHVALSLYFLPVFLGSFYLGPTFSMTQGLVGLRMRALASSILLFVLNLIGLGLGPQFVGILSDLFNASTGLGTESLRWSLVAVLIFNVVSTLFYLAAGGTLREDLARSHELG